MTLADGSTVALAVRRPPGADRRPDAHARRRRGAEPRPATRSSPPSTGRHRGADLDAARPRRPDRHAAGAAPRRSSSPAPRRTTRRRRGRVHRRRRGRRRARPRAHPPTARAALRHVYDRETVRVNANVAPATHGETVSEILGSGDAARANQRFPLKQPPAHLRRAPTRRRGRRSTLEVRVADVLWEERPSLYGAGPRDRVYTTATDDDARTTVVFGDGVEGARLPTGHQNVRADLPQGPRRAGQRARGAAHDAAHAAARRHRA